MTNVAHPVVLRPLIELLDDPQLISRKFKRAVTDSDNEVRYDPATKPGVSNLLEILGAATGRAPADLAGGYAQYGALKTDLAEVMVEFVTPFRTRTQEYLDDPETLDSLLAKGAEKARTVAAETLALTYDRMGLLPAKH